MRAITVTVGPQEDVRAYAAADVARVFGVTTKTVVAWTRSPTGRGPQLTGWAPHTVVPDDRRWLIAADDVDRELAGADARQGAVSSPLDAERHQLAEDRQLLDLERAVFLRQRTAQLEEDNAHLGDEVARLRSHIATLGHTIHTLTAPTSPTSPTSSTA